jgi:hypothetical protein
MYLDFTAEQQALRKEIRGYYRELPTPEARSEAEPSEVHRESAIARKAERRIQCVKQ